MTDLRKAAEESAKVLANALSIDFNDKRDWYSYKHDVEYATSLLRQALAQPEQNSVMSGCCAECGVKASDGYALYCVNCTDLFAQPEQEKMCVSCGKPTMHMGDKCYGCCQTAQPEQEPVAWQVMVENEPMREFTIKEVAHDWTVTEKRNGSKYSYWIRPLYAAPPKREWQGLTDEERNHLWEITPPEYEDRFGLARAIEAKIREKNS